MPQTTMHDYFKDDMASTSPRACTSGALTTDSQDVTILSREEWWACAREREVKDYHRRMTKRGILNPLPYSLNWSQNYEYELGVPQYRWDTGETIGRYYPGIVHIALAQRLPDELARLIFHGYFRHHLRECRYLGHAMRCRLTYACRVLRLDARGTCPVLKRRIFDELGVCMYTAKEYRSLLNGAAYWRALETEGRVVLTPEQRDAVYLGEALRALNLWGHYPYAQTRRQRPPGGMTNPFYDALPSVIRVVDGVVTVVTW